MTVVSNRVDLEVINIGNEEFMVEIFLIEGIVLSWIKNQNTIDDSLLPLSFCNVVLRVKIGDGELFRK